MFSSTLFAQSNFESAIVLFEKQKYEEAIILFKKELKQNNNAEVHYYLGRTYLRSGDHDKAIKHGKNAVKINDKVAEYHLLLAQSFGTKAMNSNIFTQARISSKIRKEYEKTVQLDPTETQGRIGLINYYIQAPSFMGGDIEKALEHTKILITQDEFSGRIALANIYQAQDKTDSALVQYEQLEIQYGDSPDHYRFYNSYGYLLLREKKFDNAIDKFKKQVELAPRQSNPYDSLGDAYKANGNIREAIDSYRRALEIGPTIEITVKKLKELERQSSRE